MKNVPRIQALSQINKKKKKPEKSATAVHSDETSPGKVEVNERSDAGH
jgi:hypothetical protein